MSFLQLRLYQLPQEKHLTLLLNPTCLGQDLIIKTIEINHQKRNWIKLVIKTVSLYNYQIMEGMK